MEYIYAVMLLHSAKRPITEEGLAKIIGAAGIEVDEVRIKALMSALSGVNIDEILKSATISSMPTLPSPSTTSAPPVKKEEKKEEEAIEGLAALFG